MKNAASTRYTGEICLLMLLFCFFFPGTPELLLLAAFTTALLLCGLVSTRLKKPILRLLCCLPAAALILAANHPATAIFMGVCWLYFAIRLAVGRFNMQYWVCRKEFLILIGIAVFASLLIAAGALFHISTPRGVIGFGAALVLLSIYSMRAIRFGDPLENRWGAYGAVELVIPAGIAVAFSMLLWMFFRIGWYVLQWLTGRRKPQTLPRSERAGIRVDNHYAYFNYGNPIVGGKQVAEEITDQAPNVEQRTEAFLKRLPPQFWLTLLIVIILLAAVLVLVYVLRRRKKAKSITADSDEIEEAMQRFGGREAELPADLLIRKIYRSHLSDLKKRGQDIHSSDTSRDILDGAEGLPASEAEEELRRLYLAARYGDSAAVKSEDAERARMLLEQIRTGA